MDVGRSPHQSIAWTQCLFGGCYHLIDGDIAVGLRHSLFLSLGRRRDQMFAGTAAALCAHNNMRYLAFVMAQKQTVQSHRLASALPPEVPDSHLWSLIFSAMSAIGTKSLADIPLILADVRFTPESGHRLLLDYLRSVGDAAMITIRCTHATPTGHPIGLLRRTPMLAFS